MIHPFFLALAALLAGSLLALIDAKFRQLRPISRGKTSPDPDGTASMPGGQPIYQDDESAIASDAADSISMRAGLESNVIEFRPRRLGAEAKKIPPQIGSEGGYCHVGNDMAGSAAKLVA